MEIIKISRCFYYQIDIKIAKTLKKNGNQLNFMNRN